VGICTSFLYKIGWVPPSGLPSEAPDAIVTHSYGLRDYQRLTPMTESVTLASADLYHYWQGEPLIIFATSDFEPESKGSIAETAIRCEILRTHGVNPAKIFPVSHTHDTKSEALEIKRIILKEVLLPRMILQCLNDLHIRRAWPVFQKEMGDIKVYPFPVPCHGYVRSMVPGYRSWSVASEFIWASYMVLTWAAWKFRLI